MKNKCFLCEEELKLGFLDKPQGTIVKVKGKDKTEFIFVCSNCQKKHGENLKEEVEKKTK